MTAASLTPLASLLALWRRTINRNEPMTLDGADVHVRMPGGSEVVGYIYFGKFGCYAFTANQRRVTAATYSGGFRTMDEAGAAIRERVSRMLGSFAGAK